MSDYPALELGFCRTQEIKFVEQADLLIQEVTYKTPETENGYVECTGHGAVLRQVLHDLFIAFIYSFSGLY